MQAREPASLEEINGMKRAISRVRNLHFRGQTCAWSDLSCLSLSQQTGMLFRQNARVAEWQTRQT